MDCWLNYYTHLLSNPARPPPPPSAPARSLSLARLDSPFTKATPWNTIVIWHMLLTQYFFKITKFVFQPLYQALLENSVSHFAVYSWQYVNI